ncbi:threonine--tRNA ligase, mitochondrial 1 isoform X2 [Vigna radiata var. radiata]|uniref:Threonine--tRNA ligase, mitochondrial 1 isoform X2 n=1 Tax=Vigna radiata var. radiata TaxID=3916 RepID=A0A1S3VYI2_VIGRR|nr:threonine--tRNA ligase, mitochondrial 1 isoform X2 [Vigna radiata var. radiata]
MKREKQPFERIEVTRDQALEMFSDNKFKEYLHRLEEAKKYNHRILGVKQELILHHEWSPGSWFFLPHGARVYNKLMDFIRNQYRDRGYQEVKSPNVFNMDLWVQSGHAANYREDMFILEIDKQEFGLKPMNCPGYCLMFKHRVRSYRELPLRFADFGDFRSLRLSFATISIAAFLSFYLKQGKAIIEKLEWLPESQR